MCIYKRKCHPCCCYRAVTTPKLTTKMLRMLPIHILIHCCCLPLYRYRYIAIAKPRPCHLSNLMHGGNTPDKGLGLALVSALVSGKTLESACSSRVRIRISPPWCHGGLSDDDFTISVVPIRRPRTEAAYEPRKLPTFDLHATGPPIGVPTGTPPRTPEAANLRIDSSASRVFNKDHPKLKKNHHQSRLNYLSTNCFASRVSNSFASRVSNKDH